MLAIVALGFAYFTLNTLGDSRPITYFSGAIPVMIGMAVAMYLLNFLYE